MIGVLAHPEQTLVDRTLERLRIAPCSADWISNQILGLSQAPLAVAERLVVALLGSDPRVRQLDDGRWALIPEVQGSPSIDACAFAVVDVETTGMRAWGGDRITEIAVVVVQGGRSEVVFESLINPERPIPPRIAMLTGISDDMVRHAPTFDMVADQVLAALAGRVFVAHNARFDWAFVGAEIRRARSLRLQGPRLCTVRLARRLLPDLPSRSLDSLTHYFAFQNPARHRASGDALVTARLLERLLLMVREHEVRTLAELERFQAVRSRRKALDA